MTPRTAILLSAALLAACDPAAPAARNPAAEATRTTTPAPARRGAVERWDSTACGDDAYRNARMERHPALIGRAPGELVAAYGRPAADERFRVGEPAGTFYGALGRSVPPPADAGGPARRLTWTRDGCDFNVFFVDRGGGMRAVEAFESATGADF